MMKTIERIIENIILALCFLLLVMPIAIRKYLLEIRDWVSELMKDLKGDKVK